MEKQKAKVKSSKKSTESTKSTSQKESNVVLDAFQDFIDSNRLIIKDINKAWSKYTNTTKIVVLVDLVILLFILSSAIN